MAIPRILVIQPDQTPVTLRYNEGSYRQSVTLLTVFNPQCMALDPKAVATYEELAPYARSTRSLTWLLLGLSLGILTNVIGNPGIWTFAIVAFTFALATVIFSAHRPVRHKLYQLTMNDGRRLIAAIEAEHLLEIPRQFPNAQEHKAPGLYSDNLNRDEELHVEQIRYGLVTAAASGSMIQLSNNLLKDGGYNDDLASMLTLGLLAILIGLIAVSIGKIMRVEKLKKAN